MRKREQISEFLSVDLKFELFESLSEDQIDEEFLEWLTGGSSIDIDVNSIKEQLFSHLKNANNRKVG